MNAVQPALEPSPSDHWVYLYQSPCRPRVNVKRQGKLRTESEVSLLVKLNTAGSDEKRPKKRLRKTKALSEGGKRKVLHFVCPDGSSMQPLPGGARKKGHCALMQPLLLEWVPVDEDSREASQDRECGNAERAESIRQVSRGARRRPAHNTTAHFSNVARGTLKTEPSVLSNGSWIGWKAEITSISATDPGAPSLDGAATGAVSRSPPGGHSRGRTARGLPDVDFGAPAVACSADHVTGVSAGAAMLAAGVWFILFAFSCQSGFCGLGGALHHLFPEPQPLLHCPFRGVCRRWSQCLRSDLQGLSMDF